MVGKNLRMFKEQAARDWETFLLYRSKELKPGISITILGW